MTEPTPEEAKKLKKLCNKYMKAVEAQEKAYQEYQDYVQQFDENHLIGYLHKIIQEQINARQETN